MNTILRLFCFCCLWNYHSWCLAGGYTGEYFTRGESTNIEEVQSYLQDARVEIPSPLIFLWQVQKDTTEEEFDSFRSLGVNLIQASGLIRWEYDEIEAYLRLAEKKEIGVIVYLGIDRTGTGGDCHYSARAKDIVERFKDSRAIVGWHSVDEPAEHGITRECQKALYKTIKGWDPDRPIMISGNNNTSSKYEKFFDEDAFDFYEMHKYVNPVAVDLHKKLLTGFEKARKDLYPLIITFRAYDYHADFVGNTKAFIANSFEAQYEFFIQEPKLTKNFGFYGWRLSPNLGVSQVKTISENFRCFLGKFNSSSESLDQNTVSDCRVER